MIESSDSDDDADTDDRTDDGICDAEYADDDGNDYDDIVDDEYVDDDVDCVDMDGCFVFALCLFFSGGGRSNVLDLIRSFGVASRCPYGCPLSANANGRLNPNPSSCPTKHHCPL